MWFVGTSRLLVVPVVAAKLRDLVGGQDPFDIRTPVLSSAQNVGEPYRLSEIQPVP
jgi:hypothetical protein